MATVIATVGSIAGAGATTATANLGSALAEQRRQVAVVDASVTGSRVGDVLSLSGGGEVTDALRRTAVVGDVQAAGPHGLVAFPGSDETSWGDVRPDAVATAYDRLRERFEYVLVDCGSDLTPETAAWLGHADETVVVTDPDVPGATAAVAALADAFDVDVRGLIANRVRPTDVDDAIDALEETDQRLLAVVPEDATVGAAADALESVFTTEPDSDVASCFWRLALRIRASDHDDPVVPGETLSQPDDHQVRTAPAAAGDGEPVDPNDVATSGDGSSHDDASSDDSSDDAASDVDDVEETPPAGGTSSADGAIPTDEGPPTREEARADAASVAAATAADEPDQAPASAGGTGDDPARSAVEATVDPAVGTGSDGSVDDPADGQVSATAPAESAVGSEESDAGGAGGFGGSDSPWETATPTDTTGDSVDTGRDGDTDAGEGGDDATGSVGAVNSDDDESDAGPATGAIGADDVDPDDGDVQTDADAPGDASEREDADGETDADDGGDDRYGGDDGDERNAEEDGLSDEEIEAVFKETMERVKRDKEAGANGDDEAADAGTGADGDGADGRVAGGDGGGGEDGDGDEDGDDDSVLGGFMGN